jgi:hypothetical protein
MSQISEFDVIKSKVESAGLYWEIRRVSKESYRACLHNGTPNGRWEFYRNGETPEKALQESFKQHQH